jgi:hypothetical protein
MNQYIASSAKILIERSARRVQLAKSNRQAAIVRVAEVIDGVDAKII